MVYYNEIDAYAAQWLRNLIAAGRIAKGEVDTRSIVDVHTEDLKGYKQCHFFAGIGVWSYALQQAGWPDDKEVWTGSCPCQPFSSAGKKRTFDDERHLWPEMFRLIASCKPSVVFGEQVASKDGLSWLDAVQVDLEGANYTSAAADLCAAGVGAPHIRQRLYWVADTNTAIKGVGRAGDSCVDRGKTRNSWVGSGSSSPTYSFWREADWLYCRDGKHRPVEPGTFPLAHGATARVGRLRAYGNAIVPQVAQTFIEAYMDL